MKPTLLQRLLEAGRVLSKAHETKIRAAIASLQEVLTAAAGGAAMTEAQRSEFQKAGLALLEAELSHSQQRQALSKALRAQSSSYCYIDEVFDTWLVYQCYDSTYDTEQLYKVSYVIDDQNIVTFGQPVAVMARMVYEPVTAMQESANTADGQVRLREAECMPLVEKIVRNDGTIPIKVIAPGWGSSGFYSPELLQRDGPSVFKAGTHMYWNHATESEQFERPERDNDDLAARLVSDAYWQESGADGPGLYADAEVSQDYRDRIDDIGTWIGTSINTDGTAQIGEAEGRSGRIIQSLVATPFTSIDFVTKPGAGGKILQLFESARASRPAPTLPLEESVNEHEAQALRESEQSLKVENARLKEALLLNNACTFVTARLSTMDLPDLTRARLAESLAKTPVLTDGAIDETAFAVKIDEAAAGELDYLAKTTGVGAGHISGMGGNSNTPEPVDTTVLEAQLAESFAVLGLSASEAKIAATGR